MLMIVGVWKIKGWFLKILRIGMIFDLAPKQGDAVNAMRALYFFGAFYLTFYNEGQRSLRRKHREAWEEEARALNEHHSRRSKRSG
jgi:hypothetical protein